MSIDDFTARLAHTPVPWWLARSASWALAGYAIVTGIDLLHPPAATRVISLKMVERLATLHTWGIWYLIAGGVLALGLALGRHAVVWLGHFACSILYFGFAAATLQAVWQYQSSPLAQSGGWIWRAAYVSFMIAIGHFALAWFRGPIPRRGEAE
jgi:hypothetical protein